VGKQLVPADALHWVFPAFSKSGHVEEPREKIDGVAYTIHDLRRTFITVAESLDISPLVIGALVNHRQPTGSTTAGYVAMETERLRAPMQKVNERLLALLRGNDKADTNIVRATRRQPEAVQG
jgi:hypothetical protein